ncbi:MAG: response regulator [bacterium]
MPKQILIADDEDTTREFASYFLKENGYDVIEADDGDELFKKCGKFHPDLIITDILMPGISGYKAVEKIRQKKNLPDYPLFSVQAS